MPGRTWFPLFVAPRVSSGVLILVDASLWGGHQGHQGWGAPFLLLAPCLLGAGGSPSACAVLDPRHLGGGNRDTGLLERELRVSVSRKPTLSRSEGGSVGGEKGRQQGEWEEPTLPPERPTRGGHGQALQPCLLPFTGWRGQQDDLDLGSKAGANPCLSQPPSPSRAAPFLRGWSPVGHSGLAGPQPGVERDLKPGRPHSLGLPREATPAWGLPWGARSRLHGPPWCLSPVTQCRGAVSQLSGPWTPVKTGRVTQAVLSLPSRVQQRRCE